MQLSMRRCNPLPHNTNQVMCYVYLMVTSICSLVHICHFTWGQVINLKMQAIASTQLWVCCMIQLQRIGVVISYLEYAQTNLCYKKRRD